MERRGRASWSEFDPIGMRVMDSTPAAMAMSTVPEATRLAARLAAWWLDPHWVSTVVAAVVMGRPAASQAVRAMLNDCSPTCDTHPVTTCWTAAGSMPVRSIRAMMGVPSRSAGCTVDRPPFRRPTGVRTASTITTSAIGAMLPRVVGWAIGAAIGAVGAGRVRGVSGAATVIVCALNPLGAG